MQYLRVSLSELAFMFIITDFVKELSFSFLQTKHRLLDKNQLFDKLQLFFFFNLYYEFSY